MLGVAGGVATYQQTSAPASPRTTATRAVPPDDLADRAADRAARDGRPEPRTGRIPSPNTTIKPAPPKPSPSRTRPPSPSRRPAPGWVRPTRGYDVTSGFGYRWGTMHEGVDLAAPSGTPIVTVRSGVIELAEWYGGYGYAVIVDHGAGIKTLYGHNSQLLVSEGQRVRTGQRISLMGSTGDSTGPHLHFEVRVNGEPVDPVPWMRERGVRL